MGRTSSGVDIPKEARVYVADFETRTKTALNEMGEEIAQIYVWAMKELNNEKDLHYGFDLDSLFNHFKETSLIYFHKLSFDFSYFKQYLIDRYKYVNKKKIDSGQFNFFESSDGSKCYYIKLRKRVEKGKKITLFFKCSKNLLLSSVEDLGKQYNDIEKIKDYDYHTVDTYTEDNFHLIRDYIHNDVEIVRRALNEYVHNGEQLQKDLFGEVHHKMHNIFTTSSFSKKLSESFIYKHYPRMYSDIFGLEYEDYCYLSKFYNGGFTQFNPLYSGRELADNGKEVVRYYDTNSMYPSVMVDNLPLGRVLDKQPKGRTFIRLFEIDVISAWPKKGFEHLHLIRNNWSWYNLDMSKSKQTVGGGKFRYLNSIVGYSTLYLFEEEWNELNKVYDFEIKEIKTKYLTTYPYMRKFVNDLYKRRLEYKKTNPPYANIVKLILNSLYGKFAERAYYEEVIWDKDDEYNVGDIYTKEYEYRGKINTCDYLITGEIRINKYDDLKTFKIRPTKPKKGAEYSHIGIGAYITSKARIKLFEVIIPNKEGFIYCDTDSVMLYLDKIKQLPTIHQTNLGDWKQEEADKEIINFRVNGAKSYIMVLRNKENGELTTESTVAGVQKDLEMGEFQRALGDTLLIKNAGLVPERTKHGILLNMKDKKIKLKGRL